jgi:hypothetical protein
MTVQADTNASAGYSNIPFTGYILAIPGLRRQCGVRSFAKFSRKGGDAYFRPAT